MIKKVYRVKRGGNKDKSSDLPSRDVKMTIVPKELISVNSFERAMSVIDKYAHASCDQAKHTSISGSCISMRQGKATHRRIILDVRLNEKKRSSSSMVNDVTECMCSSSGSKQEK